MTEEGPYWLPEDKASGNFTQSPAWCLDSTSDTAQKRTLEAILNNCMAKVDECQRVLDSMCAPPWSNISEPVAVRSREGCYAAAIVLEDTLLALQRRLERLGETLGKL